MSETTLAGYITKLIEQGADGEQISEAVNRHNRTQHDIQSRVIQAKRESVSENHHNRHRGKPKELLCVSVSTDVTPVDVPDIRICKTYREVETYITDWLRENYIDESVIRRVKRKVMGDNQFKSVDGCYDGIEIESNADNLFAYYAQDECSGVGLHIYPNPL